MSNMYNLCTIELHYGLERNVSARQLYKKTFKTTEHKKIVSGIC